MMKMITLAVVANLTAVVTTAMGPAWAEERQGSDGPQERAAIAAAKISRQQAIAAAVQHTGGQFVRIGIENQDGRTVLYDVTVNMAGTRQQVLVDMQSGSVVRVGADDGERTPSRLPTAW